MLTRRIGLAVMLAWSLACARGTTADERQLVPGTGVRLVPPAGYEPARFPGFMHEASSSSILVSVIRGEARELIRGFEDDELLGQRGMRRISSEQHAMGSHPGLLLRVEQEEQGLLVDKWLWVFGDGQDAVIVMGTCLRQHADQRLDELRESVLSSQWDGEAPRDAFDGLGFRLEDTGSLVWFPGMQAGGTVLFTGDGQQDTEGLGKALFVVGPSLGTAGDGEPEQFAERRMSRYPYDDIQIRETVPIVIDRMSGFETTAEGSDPRSYVDLVLYQAMLFDADGYWLVHGSVALDEEPQYLPMFRRMAQSLRRDASSGESAER